MGVLGTGAKGDPENPAQVEPTDEAPAQVDLSSKAPQASQPQAPQTPQAQQPPADKE